MTVDEANVLLEKSIYDFDLQNLKLALENGADINYDPSVIWAKGKNGLEYAVATEDSIFSDALWNLGFKIIEAKNDSARKKLEDKAFEVVKFCVERGIRLNTFYTSRHAVTETCFAISNYVSCYSEKILSYLLENGLNPNTCIDGSYTICDDLYDTILYDSEEGFDCAPYEKRMLHVLLDHGGKYSEDILKECRQ